MIAIAVVALMSTVQIEARFGVPTSSVKGFDMPIKAGVFAVAKARRSVLPDGDVMLFVPGGHGARLERELASGPVRHVHVQELARGLAIVLTPAAKMTADEVRFVDGHMRVDGEKVVGPRQADVQVEGSKADVRHAMPEGRHPTSEIRNPTPEVRHPSSDVRGPTPEVRHANADVRGLLSENSDASASGPELPKIEKPHAIKPTVAAQESSSSTRTFFTLTVLLAAGAAAIVFAKKRQLARLGHIDDGIELISVKALGTKQRLAVVDVSGERMLIAASDQGLQLLSRLKDAPRMNDSPPQQTQAQSLANFASALEDASAERITHPTPKTRRSTDVAGLIKLRAASAWTLGEAGDLT